MIDPEKQVDNYQERSSLEGIQGPPREYGEEQTVADGVSLTDLLKQEWRVESHSMFDGEYLKQGPEENPRNEFVETETREGIPSMALHRLSDQVGIHGLSIEHGFEIVEGLAPLSLEQWQQFEATLVNEFQSTTWEFVVVMIDEEVQIKQFDAEWWDKPDGTPYRQLLSLDCGAAATSVFEALDSTKAVHEVLDYYEIPY